MRIKWHGHSCFELSDGNTTLIIDPHDGKSIGIKPPRATADIVLMTHSHYDHNAARVINGDHRDHLAHNGKFECRCITFNGYPTFHDDKNGTLRGLNTMYMFQLDGLSICHCGDLGDIPSAKIIKAVEGVDIMFIPVGGVYTMEKEVLKEFIDLVRPGIIIPMHYRIGGLTLPIASVDDFLEMIPDEFVRYVGNSIEISKDERPDQKECWVFDRQ